MAWQPISRALGEALRGSPLVSEGAFQLWWWIHNLVVLGFLVYIPGSKHLHLIGAPLTVFFTKTTPRGHLKPILDIENQETFGASRADQFTWRQLLDAYACTHCGRCDRACPALNTGKPLSPKMIILGIHRHLFSEKDTLLAKGATNAPKAALIGDLITDDALWSCTTCRACMEVCPVFIEHVDAIVDMRRWLVLTESRFPRQLAQAFVSMENNGNPFMMPRAQRGDWAKPLGVKTMAEVHGDVDILYWVGCAASYDDRNRKVAEAMVKILQAAGVRFAILGKEETCTGDPARRGGNEYLYQLLAQENIKTLNRYKPKLIITTCPHCFNTIKNEYPDFDGHYTVMHHSAYIAHLLTEGRIKLRSAIDGISITFHDPCYLGRYNDIYDAPRDVIRAVSGRPPVEMGRTRSASFCCGAGGARMWMEETIGTRVNQNRAEEAIHTGATVVGTACPYCMSMFVDGLKAKGAGTPDTIVAKDIAELVAEHLAQ
jgi:Fe-S oxidoreductase